jgi:hypothetical protein
MQIFQAIKADSKLIYTKLRSLHSITISILFYLFAVVSDYASTKFVEHRHIPDVIETNQFARDKNMHIVLHKAIVIDMLVLVVLIITAFCIYEAVRRWNTVLADIIISGGFVYLAFDRLYNAVIPNVLFGLRFFVPNPNENLFRLFGKIIGS